MLPPPSPPPPPPLPLSRSGDAGVASTAALSHGPDGGAPPHARDRPKTGGLAGVWWALLAVFTNWRFVVPYAVNQGGSMAFNMLLGAAPISLAAPVVNSLTVVVTALTAHALGEKQTINRGTVLGTALVMGGVALCMAASSGSEVLAVPTAASAQ
jgi:drug/metabolite transporter (DMT)-like permease